MVAAPSAGATFSWKSETASSGPSGAIGRSCPVAAGQRRVAWHAAEPRPADSAKPARRISSSPTDHIRTRSPAGSYMGRNDALAPYRSPATWISKADDSISSRVTPSSTSM